MAGKVTVNMTSNHSPYENSSQKSLNRKQCNT